jgi:hypothetical protein
MTIATVTTATPQEFFAYHRDALDGKNPPIIDGKPQGGTYRMRTVRDGPFVPVMIDLDGVNIVIEVDGKRIPEADYGRVWSFCAKHPVEPEDLFYRLDHGVWPGEDAPPAKGSLPGDNAPPEDVDLPTQLREKIEAAAAWLKKIGNKIADRQTMEALANRIAGIRQIKTATEKAQKAECEPLYRVYKDAYAKYDPAIKDADKVLKALIRVGEEYAERERREQAERERAAAEAARQAEAAEAARRAGAEPAAETAPTNVVPLTTPAPPTAPPKQSYGGAVGRKLGVKSKKVARIVDQDAVYQFHKTDPEVVTLLAKLAQRCVDAGVTCPGVEIEDKVKLG